MTLSHPSPTCIEYNDLPVEHWWKKKISFNFNFYNLHMFTYECAKNFEPVKEFFFGLHANPKWPLFVHQAMNKANFSHYQQKTIQKIRYKMTSVVTLERSARTGFQWQRDMSSFKFYKWHWLRVRARMPCPVGYPYGVYIMTHNILVYCC